MITETRKAELTAIIERRRQNPHEAPSPGDVVWLNHEEQIFFDALAAKLNLRDAATHAKQLEEKARDTRAAIRDELDSHPLLRELTSKAEATQAEIVSEAVKLYKQLEPEKSAALAAYLDTGTIKAAARKTGISQGKVHKLLKAIENEQGVEIITRRRGLEGEHIGEHYRQNGHLRNRSHRAG